MTQLFHGGGVPRRAPLRVTLCALFLLFAFTGCSSSSSPEPTALPEPTEPSSTAGGPVQPVVPTVTGPAPTRTPPLSLVPAPATGSVQVEEGAFTDRLAITDLALQPGDRPAVTANLQNIADVSGLIVLELRADFYDSAGAYLGFGTAAYADEEFADTGATPLPSGTGEHGGTFIVTVPSNAPLSGASSAILTIPQLVNE